MGTVPSRNFAQASKISQGLRRITRFRVRLVVSRPRPNESRTDCRIWGRGPFVHPKLYPKHEQEVFEETAKVSKSKTDLIFWSPRGHCHKTPFTLQEWYGRLMGNSPPNNYPPVNGFDSGLVAQDRGLRARLLLEFYRGAF